MKYEIYTQYISLDVHGLGRLTVKSPIRFPKPAAKMKHFMAFEDYHGWTRMDTDV